MSNFKVCLTHDVDRVYKSYQYVTQDLLHFKFNNIGTILSKENPYWNFEKIIALEEKFNVKSTLFFLEESIPLNIFSFKNWKLFFGKYRFADSKIADTIRNFDSKGWEIGLHGSYNSYKNFNLLLKEKRSLENVLGKPITGIRQHYLNLIIPETWILHKKTGFLYDTSLGKKKKIGFPNNTYHPFINKESGLLIIPLALMDGYLFTISRSIEDAWNKCLKLIDEAEKNNAVMVVLWHQRVFNDREFPGYKELYEKLIIECKQRNAEFLLCRELLNKVSEYGRL